MKNLLYNCGLYASGVFSGFFIKDVMQYLSEGRSRDAIIHGLGFAVSVAVGALCADATDRKINQLEAEVEKSAPKIEG